VASAFNNADWVGGMEAFTCGDRWLGVSISLGDGCSDSSVPPADLSLTGADPSSAYCTEGKVLY
jgi:hypothetical protein